MQPGFDDFLDGLRGQLVRAAQAASETAPQPAARTPRAGILGRLPLRQPRTALVWAALVLLVGAATVAGVFLVAPAVRQSPSSAGNAIVPDTHISVSPYRVEPLVPAVVASPSAAPDTLEQADYLLSAVAARPAGDVWAVGARVVPDETGPSGAQGHTFILRWDGAQWRETPAPDVGPLSAVAVAANGDAWALSGTSAAILRWDGVQWAAIQPELPEGGVLNGLAVVAADDVWAVGGRPGGPLLVHYDGESWKTIDAPALPDGGGTLYSVSGSSPTDVWAVGVAADGTHGLTLHWDGATWSPVPNADVGADAATALYAVAAVSPTDAWAGGALLQRWDGTQWKAVPDRYGSISGAISAVSATDIWMRAADGRSAVHLNGETWQSVSTVDMGLAGDANTTVEAVAAAAADDVWVVGTVGQMDGGRSLPLVLHWDGVDWRVVVNSMQPAEGE
jgi:hypothetical protein